MNTLQNNETTEKNKVILDATEKIETVMGFDPHFQSHQHQIGKIEVSPGQSAGLIVLWVVVLLAQVLMFGGQRGQKSK